MPKVPATLDEVLSPEWLTAALAPRFPGIAVTTVTAGPVVSRGGVPLPAAAEAAALRRWHHGQRAARVRSSESACRV